MLNDLLNLHHNRKAGYHLNLSHPLASQRAKKGWITKHLKNQYKSELQKHIQKLSPHLVDFPDDNEEEYGLDKDDLSHGFHEEELIPGSNPYRKEKAVDWPTESGEEPKIPSFEKITEEFQRDKALRASAIQKGLDEGTIERHEDLVEVPTPVDLSKAQIGQIDPNVQLHYEKRRGKVVPVYKKKVITYVDKESQRPISLKETPKREVHLYNPDLLDEHREHRAAKGRVMKAYKVRPHRLGEDAHTTLEGLEYREKVIILNNDPERISRLEQEGITQEDLANLGAFSSHTVSPDEVYDQWKRPDGSKGPPRNWGEQHAFTKEMRGRKWNARLSGDNYRGYAVDWNKPQLGKPTFAPESKANVFVTSPKEFQYTTHRWKPVDENDFRDPEFTMTLLQDPVSDLRQYYKEGDDIRKGDLEGVAEIGVPLQKVLKEANVRVDSSDISAQDFQKGEVASGYKISMRSKDLDPDKARVLAHFLNSTYGTASVDENGEPAYNLEGPAMYQELHRRPWSETSRGLPQDVESAVVGTRLVDRYPQGGHILSGQRDIHTGELLPNQRDVLSYRVKTPNPLSTTNYYDKVGAVRLGESTDAIGWGTSWRPGEQEVSRVATAIPKAKRQRELHGAMDFYLANKENEGNDTKLRGYVGAHHTNLNPGEKERLIQEMKNTASRADLIKEHKKDPETLKDSEDSKFVNETLEFGAAASSAAFYTGHKLMKKQGEKTVTQALARKFPHAADYLKHKGVLPEDFEIGAEVPLRTKINRARWRIPHPLSDPDAGVTGFKSEYRGWSPGKPIISNRDIGAAKVLEQKQHEAFSIRDSIAQINEAINAHPTDLKGKIKQRIALHKAEVILKNPDYTDYDKNVADELIRHGTRVTEDLDYYKPEPHSKLLGKFLFSKEDFMPYGSYTGPPHKNLPQYHEAQEMVSVGKKLKEQHIGLSDKFKIPTVGELGHVEKPALLPHPHITGKQALIGAGAIAAVAGGLYLYDRHRKHKLEQAQQLGIPMNTQTQERTIGVPSLELKHKDVKVPANAVTTGLDLAGKTFPSPFRKDWDLQLNKKQLVVRGRKDVSKEGYAKGLPIVGSIKLRKDNKGGSWSDSVAFNNDPGPGNRYKNVGSTGNVYIKGKKLPIDVYHGPQERWGSKKYKLTASNPNKLTSAEREKMALLAARTGDPDIYNYFASDPKFREIIDDPEKMDYLRNVKYPEFGFRRGYRPHDYGTSRGQSVLSDKFYTADRVDYYDQLSLDRALKPTMYETGTTYGETDPLGRIGPIKGSELEDKNSPLRWDRNSGRYTYQEKSPIDYPEDYPNVGKAHIGLTHGRARNPGDPRGSSPEDMLLSPEEKLTPQEHMQGQLFVASLDRIDPQEEYQPSLHNPSGKMYSGQRQHEGQPKVRNTSPKLEQKFRDTVHDQTLEEVRRNKENERKQKKQMKGKSKTPNYRPKRPRRNY